MAKSTISKTSASEFGSLPVAAEGPVQQHVAAILASPAETERADHGRTRVDGPQPPPAPHADPVGAPPGSETPQTLKIDGSQFPDPVPDAPYGKVGRRTTVAMHATALIFVAGFVLWFIAIAPIREAINAPKKQTTVRIVGSSLEEIRAVTAGTFVAKEPLKGGATVKQGQVLGRLEARQLALDLQAQERMRMALYRRKLILEGDQLDDEDIQQRQELEREFREVALRIEELQSLLEHNRQLHKELIVHSPCDGRIQFGVSKSKAVKAHDTLAFIWPDDGALLVEVEGPIDVIHSLIRAGHVDAKFSTPDGQVAVTAEPIRQTLRTFRHAHNSAKAELWGFVQCTPVSIPDGVRFPGPIGKLK